MDYSLIIDVCNKEMVPALGCSDPGCISYAAAFAKKYVPEEDYKIRAYLCKNLIKSASAVVIPGTDGICGAKMAAALGAIAGDPEKKLASLEGLQEEQIEKARAFVDAGGVTVDAAETDNNLYLKLIIESDAHSAQVELADDYDNIFSILVDGEWLLSADNQEGGASGGGPGVDYSVLSFENIIDFVENAPFSYFELFEETIRLNELVMEDGLKKPYGVQVGEYLTRHLPEPPAELDYLYLGRCAAAAASAGVDARMGGSACTAMSSAGSGNQGISGSMSVVAAAKVLGKSYEETVRAVALSMLISIYIKKKIGNLSPACGAAMTGIGLGCALIHMTGGGIDQMVMVLQSMVGDMPSLLCDGAKASCALKMVTSIEAGALAAGLAMEGKFIPGTNGIVGEGEAETIDNYVRVAKEGLSLMNDITAEIILAKGV